MYLIDILPDQNSAYLDTPPPFFSRESSENPKMWEKYLRTKALCTLFKEPYKHFQHEEYYLNT